MQTVYDCFPNIDDIRKPTNFPDIKDETFWRVFKKCEPYSMIGVDAFYNIFKSVEYITKNKLAGDFVECGVFLGGAAMAVAEFLAYFEGIKRKIFLYDTFEGFPDNTKDYDVRGNEVKFHRHENFRDVVERNLASCEYDLEQFEIIPGCVEDTLAVASNLPERISYLRLDTDYYESTKVEFHVLYPRLVARGICTIDDYGTFQGAQRATDEYLAECDYFPMTFRINSGVRVLVKS